jgi:hypothetical protein
MFWFLMPLSVLGFIKIKRMHVCKDGSLEFYPCKKKEKELTDEETVASSLVLSSARPLIAAKVASNDHTNMGDECNGCDDPLQPVIEAETSGTFVIVARIPASPSLVLPDITTT